MDNISKVSSKVSIRLGWWVIPPLLLKWFVIAGVYGGVIALFFLLKAQGGNNPELIDLGPFHLRWYGVLITCGVGLASFLATYLANRSGENPDHIWRILPIVMVASLVVARLWFVVFTWPTYAVHPEKIVAIWEGGLAIQGGVLGGLGAGLIYCHRAKISLWRWVDFVAPGLVLAQAIGRWGNFMNNEAYGRPTSLPWGIKIPCQYRTDGHPGTVDTRCNVGANPGPDGTFHPTFLYESLWDYGCFLLLLYLSLHHDKPGWLSRKLGWKRRDGDIFLGYWIIYSTGRFFTESLRTDSLTYAGLRTAQVTAVVAIIICSSWLVFRHRNDHLKRVKGPNTPDTDLPVEVASASFMRSVSTSDKHNLNTSTVSLPRQNLNDTQTRARSIEETRGDNGGKSILEPGATDKPA